MLTLAWSFTGITLVVHALVTWLSGLMALLQMSLTSNAVCFLLNQTRSSTVIRGNFTTGNSNEIHPSESTNAILLGPNEDNSRMTWERSSHTNHQCWCIKATSVLVATVMDPVATCSAFDVRTSQVSRNERCTCGFFKVFKCCLSKCPVTLLPDHLTWPPSPTGNTYSQ